MNVMAKAGFSRETGVRHETCAGAAPWKFQEPIPTIWRVALGSLVAIVLLMGINLYAVLQLREVTTLSIELVSQRYPAIESAKWLLTNLYTQLTSEKKYLVIRDPWYLMEFLDEAEEFSQTLTVLRNQESSPEGRAILGEAEQLYAEYRVLFRTHVNQRRGSSPKETASYEKKRDAVVALIAQRLHAYVGLHETQVSHGVNDVRLRADRTQALSQLTIAALLLALGMVGVVGFSVLRMLRRGEGSVVQDGSGDVDVTRGGASATIQDVDAGATVLMPRAWRQIRQVVP